MHEVPIPPHYPHGQIVHDWRAVCKKQRECEVAAGRLGQLSSQETGDLIQGEEQEGAWRLELQWRPNPGCGAERRERDGGTKHGSRASYLSKSGVFTEMLHIGKAISV